MIIKADDLQREIQALDKLLQDRQPGLLTWCTALGYKMKRVKQMIADAQEPTNIFILKEELQNGEEREASE